MDSPIIHLTQPLFELPFGLTLFIALILGLIVGSFLSMLTYRLPRQLLEADANTPHYQILSKGRSHCPHCHSPLPWYRLIPVFSWLASRGRCHHCKQAISTRYPLIELSSAALTMAVVWQFGLSITGLAALVFVWILLAISVIDWEFQLILDSLSLPLLWLGLLLNTQTLFTSLESAVWGAALGYLILWLVFHGFRLFTGKEGMGYGDFKMLAALGAWFGVETLNQLILIAALSSLVITLLQVWLAGKKQSSPFAFGPFLALAGLVTLFFGPI
ncbi:MAG: prepilin peptidase [Thiotrichales bacterium]|nr:prepilin peptidase [Thiotrichales bacterium]